MEASRNVLTFTPIGTINIKIETSTARNLFLTYIFCFDLSVSFLEVIIQEKDFYFNGIENFFNKIKTKRFSYFN